ncbi:MAG: hypothetical protein GF364_09880, partial [Candidatus Lokiarchaeota archaeon]|nr:hypothetical protein [Candidatus Lokiarchaeota archaeon]
MSDTKQMVEEIHKRAEKTRKDVLKDIEIDRLHFAILYCLFISIGSVLSLNVKLGNTIINTYEIFGMSLVLFGFSIGIIIATLLIDMLERRFPALIIILFFSGVSTVLELLIAQNPQFESLQAIIISLNSLIVGAITIFLFVLTIQYTSMLERGRILALLFIMGAITIIPLVAMAYNDRLLIVPSLVPIFSAFFLFKNRNQEKNEILLSEKEIEERNEKSTIKKVFKRFVKNFRLQLLFNRSYLINILLLGAFGIIIGLIVPVTSVINLSTQEIFQKHFFILLLAIMITLSLVSFLIGLIFDFWGRRTVISIFVLAIGITNFLKSIFEQTGVELDRQYAIMTVVLIIQLLMLIPLT